MHTNNLFYLGAIDKENGSYVSPLYAKKNYKYKCPDCDIDIILRRGQINKPHFAHKKNTKMCNYYHNPNESQIHKGAKLLIKSLIENGCILEIIRECSKCNDEIVIETPNHNNCTIKVEHGFVHNGEQKCADVCILNNGTKTINCIYEVYYKHKTNEKDRPEPWFEIDALDLIQNHNKNIIKTKCIRDFICQKCISNFIDTIDSMIDCSNMLTNILFYKNEPAVYKEWIQLFVLDAYEQNLSDEEYTWHWSTKECLTNKNNKWIINKKLDWNYYKNNVYVYLNKNKVDNKIDLHTKIYYNKFIAELNSFIHKINNNIYFDGYNRLSGMCAVYNKSLIQKLIDIDLKNIIHSICTHKGTCSVIFRENFDNLNKNEKIDIILKLESLWKNIMGEDEIEFENTDGFIIKIENNKLEYYEQSIRRIYFNVKYHMKEEFKTYGGKWDEIKKMWYIYECAKNIENITKAKNMFSHFKSYSSSLIKICSKNPCQFIDFGDDDL
jgi:hypothetical protein